MEKDTTVAAICLRAVWVKAGAMLCKLDMCRFVPQRFKTYFSKTNKISRSFEELAIEGLIP